ncbi:amidohydrolase family protein [Tomitella biformata]|uniref:amidohydrolase family protein n=1 Tax=Tomitella biformata TaxID=630403 RepID=UPI000464493D|nr:amidohydrolase family protein [Tomitella biformata]
MTLIVNAEVESTPGTDVRIVGSRITEIGRGLAAGTAAVVDARGGALIPGLTDHHLHLHALAADSVSIRCGPPQVHDGPALAAALESAPGDEHGWVRGVGYIDTVAGDLDAAALDRLHARRPVRVQHRSGAMWVLNSAAIAATGLAAADHPGVERDASGAPTGRIWRADDWLRERLPAGRPPALGAVGAELTRLGITTVTDATPDLRPGSLTAIAEAVASGEVPQRVHLLGAPLAGAPLHPRMSVGPYKIVLADSGLPDLDALAGAIRAAHAVGRPVAAHCVSRESLLILLAVLHEVGTLSGDRVEHGALVPRETIADLARLGLRVVTQPGFLAHRGDYYLREVEPRDLPDLYRCRSLLDAGVPLALSSDAPYGPLDPWAVMAAAIAREAPTGEVVGADERISAAAALAGYLSPAKDPGGPARQIVVGGEADLVLLHVPVAEAWAAPAAELVRLTVIGGHRYPAP